MFDVLDTSGVLLRELVLRGREEERLLNLFFSLKKRFSFIVN